MRIQQKLTTRKNKFNEKCNKLSESHIKILFTQQYQIKKIEEIDHILSGF